MCGVFNQNLFSFASNDAHIDFNISIIQAIVSYSLPKQGCIGTSEMNRTYDGRARRWSTLPVGVKLARLHKFGALPVQFSDSYEHNFADDAVGARWTVNFSMRAGDS